MFARLLPNRGASTVSTKASKPDSSARRIKPLETSLDELTHFQILQMRVGGFFYIFIYDAYLSL